MKRVSFILMMALALAAAPITAQQGQAGAGVSTGRAKVCRDSKGAAYSPGALLRAADGSIDRCDDGEWVPAPASTTGTSAQASPSSQGRAQPTVNSTAQGTSRMQPVNVRIDLKINDQSFGGAPVQKSISLIAADGYGGRVRSTGTLTQEYIQGSMQTPEGKPLVGVRVVGEVQLNVDANVSFLDQDRIRAMITLEYTPGPSEPLPAGSVFTRSPLNQLVTVILTSGKPLVITQAADPLSDRKITVEATATILR